MSSARTLVSVLTPSLNQAEWLADNLRSVASQTYPHIEHIVMDGGSSDSTLELLDATRSAVKWRSEPDTGQSNAVNKAFAESHGDIIGWLNSDDAYFDSTVVEAVVAHFDRNPEVDVVYGHCLQVTADGHAIQVLWAPKFDRDRQLAVNLFMQPSTFLRRAALSDPLLDESFHFAMDYELWLRLAAHGKRFARLNRILSIDRHQQARKSSTLKEVNFADLKRLETTYGLHLSSDHDRARSWFYVQQRLMGAFLIPKIRPEKLAFTAPADVRRGLLGRQLVTRRSNWPEEYR